MMTKFAFLAGAALALVSTAAVAADPSSGRKDQTRGEAAKSRSARTASARSRSSSQTRNGGAS